ncbi:MAG: DUF4142 domain-containing protein [Candidatus Pseudobacter hemicellulosilyticus]|uniref:DUF4142 domain-containing protein n=1 Tax=Candidatus Pseudobacter hemicellulosilyticus TaxID=3121375 RepID=A0AAJ5WMQ4_9BACT|nr:MAG: DUF4142 domain-containing protein [Pseudobacter sp.]
MKKTMFPFAAAALLIGSLTIGCGDNQPKEEPGTKEAAEESNDQKFKTDSSEKNAQFVVDAVEANATEIRLAELALQKSSDKEVKDIAKQLVTDHTAALNDLKVLAGNKSISIPTEDPEKAKEKVKDLSEKKPADFNKAWTDQLMEKHMKTISDYERALNELSDQDIKNWINTVLPKIRAHHDKLMALNSKLKK